MTTPSIASRIAVIDGHPTTTTLDIANVYGKRHDNVVSLVRQRMTECPEEWCLLNFKEVIGEYQNGKGGTQTCPVIRMTKKGFHFVVGKFTGKKAVQHQIAFADEFERMEAELQKQHTRPFNPAIDYQRISPAQAQHLKELVQQVVDAGVQKHSETWARLHRKFQVNSYLQLSATQFDEACQYLKNKLPPPAPNNQAPSNVSIKGSRWLHLFDANGNEFMQRIPEDACVMTVPQFAQALTRNDIPATTETLVQIAQASMTEVKRRLSAQSSLTF